MGLPRVKTHVARRDIYKIGKKTPADNKQGFKHTRYEPSDEQEDEVLIPKGSMYYTWKRKNQPQSYSLTEPVFPVLKSEYDENMENFNASKENLEDEDAKEQLVTEIEEFRDELDGRLNNMPEQLQESSILNERIEELDSLIGEVNEIEIDE